MVVYLAGRLDSSTVVYLVAMLEIGLVGNWGNLQVDHLVVPWVSDTVVG